MADISKIKSLDGQTVYDIKDATARSLLNSLSNIAISDTAPTGSKPLIWIDPEPDVTTQVLTEDDLPGFAGIHLTTVKTIEREIETEVEE